MFKLRCKRHYRNLAAYSWYTTWREYVTKTAPARRRHSVGGGGVSKISAAAAHSSSSDMLITQNTLNFMKLFTNLAKNVIGQWLLFWCLRHCSVASSGEWV